MKSKVKAVLLKPFTERSRALLREGPCGSRPPLAFRCKGVWYQEGDRPDGFPISDPWGPRDGQALVLVWDGKTVQSGVDVATAAAFFIPDLLGSAPALGDRFFRPDEIVQWVGPCLAEGLDFDLVLVGEES